MGKSLKVRTDEYLQIAAEHEKRAVRTSDVQTLKALQELARQYRRLAVEASDDPYGIG